MSHSDEFPDVETYGAVKNTFIYHPKWFYLGLADGEAAYFFLDFAPEEGGEIGQVILMNWDTNQVVSPSLLDFFEDFVVPSLKQTVLDEDY